MKKVCKSVLALLAASASTQADMVDYYMMAVIPVMTSSPVGTITSESTGRVWMDRNLGASRVCEMPEDEACYGGYYQWGRLRDGHEDANSSITDTLADTTVPGHGYFITSLSDWTVDDENGSRRQEAWNPCPPGFRVPSIDEWQGEGLQNRTDAFEKLKIPSAGDRAYYAGVVGYRGEYALLWSLSQNEYGPQVLSAYNASVGIGNNNRATGASLRCIEKLPAEQ